MPDLSRLIPLERSCDPGCRLWKRGELWRRYRRLNPNARLLAIDNDPAMVVGRAPNITTNVCRKLTRAATEPVRSIRSGRHRSHRLQAAVLEHLAGPVRHALARHAEALSPDDGMMLMCVSNVEHWSRTERLLRGTRSAMRTPALLDRRHPRWLGL